MTTESLFGTIPRLAYDAFRSGPITPETKSWARQQLVNRGIEDMDGNVICPYLKAALEQIDRAHAMGKGVAS